MILIHIGATENHGGHLSPDLSLWSVKSCLFPNIGRRSLLKTPGPSMGKDNDLIEAGRVGNIVLIEKLLGQRTRARRVPGFAPLGLAFSR